MQIWGAWQQAQAEMVDHHRRARERLASLRKDLRRLRDEAGSRDEPLRQQRLIAERAGVAAAAVASGWLGDPWPMVKAKAPLGSHAADDRPVYVRIGEAQAAEGATVPLVIPLLGALHLAIDTGVRDPRVAGLFQSVLTRVLAALPSGAVRVVAYDPAGLGRVWAPYRELAEAGVLLEVDTLGDALAEGEEQVRLVRDEPGAPRPYLLVALGGRPASFGGDDEARLLALAHAGIGANVALLVAEWPPARPYGEIPVLDTTIQLTAKGKAWEAGLPGKEGTAFNFPVVLDPPPPDAVIAAVCGPLAAQARAESELTFAELLVDPSWQESSAAGLATPIGRKGRAPHVVRFDDATPHWMVGGRSGSGKTNFLLDVLAGLTVRYSPRELALYLLDFKEGVSFTEFTPTPHDPTWIPHAVAVGVESDREYGVAVLRALRAEMGRRAGEMKRAGVTKLIDLRKARPDVAFPRVLAVIDEFQVLFVGGDNVVRQATELLEEIARKGRSYGVHLILASQTMSGIEALATKTESIFGQFPMRVALAGGGGVLATLNKAADGLAIGEATVNTDGGIAGANTLVRIPYADPDGLDSLRHRLWERRGRGSAPPSVFVGYAPQHLEHDPTYAGLKPEMIRRTALIGRKVDVGSPTAGFDIDATPGRHIAVLGPSAVGADVLHAAVASLARQHRPGEATFLLAPLVSVADEAVAATARALRVAGHEGEIVPLAALGLVVGALAKFELTTPQAPTYLVLFGADAASPALSVSSVDSAGDYHSGLADLQKVIREGPPRGVHVFGWWRGLARFREDAGSSAVEDVACLAVLNVPGNELQNLLNRFDLEYKPRDNRAFLFDRHANTASLIVPFVRQGASDEVEL